MVVYGYEVVKEVLDGEEFSGRGVFPIVTKVNNDLGKCAYVHMCIYVHLCICISILVRDCGDETGKVS